MRRWLHLRILRHQIVRWKYLGNPAAEVYGKVFTCSCDAWWAETYWKKEKK